jgi:hypothetical protein
MRRILLLGAVGLLSTADCMVNSGAQAQMRGSAPGTQGRRRLDVQVPIRRYGGGGGRTGRMFFAVEYETLPVPDVYAGQMEPGTAGPGEFVVGAETGGPEHVVPIHLPGAAPHARAHAAGADWGNDSLIAQPATSGSDSDDGTATTAQPAPSANPVWARPPGAAGPGRRISGSSGPGTPGPGQRTRPRLRAGSSPFDPGAG